MVRLCESFLRRIALAHYTNDTQGNDPTERLCLPGMLLHPVKGV